MNKNKIKMQNLLARVPLFESMLPEELGRIAFGSTEMRAARGRTIFRCGDPCAGFYVVLYGQIKLSFTAASGAEKVIELIGPGNSFGEALMFMERDYIVTAQAMEDSLLLHVAKAIIFREIHGDPDFAWKMLANLGQRVHAIMCDMESISLRSGTQRVAAYLLKDTVSEGNPIGTTTLSAAKSVVASRLNLTPEHFSRIMTELRKRNLIAVRGRQISILDRGALRHCAG